MVTYLHFLICLRGMRMYNFNFTGQISEVVNRTVLDLVVINASKFTCTYVILYGARDVCIVRLMDTTKLSLPLNDI